MAMRQVSDAMDDDDNGDNGDAELTALFTQLKALVEEIDSRITRQATMEQGVDRRAAGNPLGTTGDAQWDRQRCENSVSSARSPRRSASRVDAGREQEGAAKGLARRSGRRLRGHRGAARGAVSPRA